MILIADLALADRESYRACVLKTPNTRDKGNLIFHSYSITDVRAPCVFAAVKFSSFRVVSYGLAVRIPGFHPGGPSSTLGMGISIPLFFRS